MSDDEGGRRALASRDQTTSSGDIHFLPVVHAGEYLQIGVYIDLDCRYEWRFGILSGECFEYSMADITRKWKQKSALRARQSSPVADTTATKGPMMLLTVSILKM